MEGNIETTKETSQVSSCQKQRTQNQFKNRQYVDHHKGRSNIIKPTCSDSHPNNACGEIEQHQPVSYNESTEYASLGQSHEAGDDINNWEKHCVNTRRAGQNGYRADKRFNPRQPSNQDRRSNSLCGTNSNSTYENPNGKKQFTKGGSSFRGITRGRGRSNGFRQGGTGEDKDKRNGPVSNSHNMRLSPATAATEELVAAKPNAWTDNPYPITRAFKNSALKELSPNTLMEEKEMMELAIKKSLEESRSQQKHYCDQQRERRCSNSSDEVCINEVEEAKKILQAHNDFPPSPEIMAQRFTIDHNEIKPPGISFSRKDHSNTIEAKQFTCAIPKKNALLPTGRGLGRGRKRIEGKIGELVASSGSVAQSHSETSSAVAMPKLKSPQVDVDNEQFSPEIATPSSKTDLGSCATQLETETRNVSHQDNVPSVDLPSHTVMSPPQQLKELEMLAQQAEVPNNVTQQKTDAVVQIAAQTPFIPASSKIDSDTTNGGLQHCENPAMATEKSDQSKDEEIRKLREELNRLKLDQNANNSPPYGLMPSYVLPMHFYQPPLPGIPVPFVQNKDCIYDSSVAHLPSYVPNAQMVGMHDMYQIQMTAISAVCKDSANITSSSNLDAVDKPVFVSNLSATAPTFYPRSNPSDFSRNDLSFEVRKPKPRYQNFNKRGNAKKYEYQPQSYNNIPPNFNSLYVINNQSFPNPHLSMPPLPGNEYFNCNYTRGYDHGPSE